MKLTLLVTMVLLVLGGTTGFTATFPSMIQQKIDRALEHAPYLSAEIQAYETRFQKTGIEQPVLERFEDMLDIYAGKAKPKAVPPSALSKILDSHERVNDADANCVSVDFALSKDGSTYLAVWQDFREGLGNPDIYGQYFNLLLEPIGTNFRINAAGAAEQTDPAIAATADSGFVVVWIDYRSGTPQVYGRKINGDRTFFAPETSVGTSTNPHLKPDVSADENGLCWITWLESIDFDYEVYFTRFRTTGEFTRDFAQVLVNDSSDDYQWYPEIASMPQGTTMICWEDKRNGNSDIYAQLFDSTASKRGSNVRIDDSPAEQLQWTPDIAAWDNGFGVVWEDYRLTIGSIFASWLDADGITADGNINVDDSVVQGARRSPTLAIREDGQTVFGWQIDQSESINLFARAFMSDGTPMPTTQLTAGGVGANHNSIALYAQGGGIIGFWHYQPNGSSWQNTVVEFFSWEALPVELASFRAILNGETVYLNWQTTSETNNYGFAVQRSNGEEFEQIGFVPGNGTTQSQQIYQFTDSPEQPGEYSYRLQQIDLDGSVTFSEAQRITLQPDRIKLAANYPNPFNAQTRIDFELPAAAHASLTIIDLQGRTVKTLVDQTLQAGLHSLVWDSRNEWGNLVASGLYLYRLQAGEETRTNRLLLVK